MTERMRQMFFDNIDLLDMTDKAVLCFREQNYVQALAYMPKISEGLRGILDGIVRDREYFQLVSVESLIEMLEGILEASRCSDYVLLADLLELQLSTLLCNVQELLMKKEEVAVFDEKLYQKRCMAMRGAMRRGGQAEEAERLLSQTIHPEELLQKGYRVEYTSCGLMTLAVRTEDGSHYLHTNHKVLREAYLLAKTWYSEHTGTYLVRGFGLGYPVRELVKLAPNAKIEIFESNEDILRLACAFSPVSELLENQNISLVHDSTGRIWDVRTEELEEHEKICLHMPSILQWKKEAGQ